MKKLSDIIKRLEQVQEQGKIVREELDKKIDGELVDEIKKKKN
jgi:hypothetical protein